MVKRIAVWRPHEVIEQTTELVRAEQWDRIDPARLVEALRLASLISSGKRADVPPVRRSTAMQARKAMEQLYKAVLGVHRGPTVKQEPPVTIRIPRSTGYQALGLATIAKHYLRAIDRYESQRREDPMNTDPLLTFMRAEIDRLLPHLSQSERAAATRQLHDDGNELMALVDPLKEKHTAPDLVNAARRALRSRKQAST